MNPKSYVCFGITPFSNIRLGFKNSPALLWYKSFIKAAQDTQFLIYIFYDGTQHVFENDARRKPKPI